jgi:dTDP-4-dehydrorhamnose 3,5-epimerase
MHVEPLIAQARQARQTVTADWQPAEPLGIEGVQVKDIRNVVVRSGILTECYRPEWFEGGFQAGHVVHVSLMAGGVSSWHCHREQKDVIIPVAGQLRLGLYDDRPESLSFRAFRTLHVSVARPMAIMVPPLVWHALKNASSEPASYVVVNDRPFDYENPDDWTLPAGSKAMPHSLD